MVIYYRSYRIVNGEAKWIITDDNDNIIYNPTNEKIKTAVVDTRKRNIYKNRKCYKCGKSGNYKEIPHRYYDEKGNWDRISYLCRSCWDKDYQKNDPYSFDNIRKLLTKSRTNNLDKDSNWGMTIISQAVVARYLKVQDLNIKMNNLSWYIDIEHEKYKKIDVKYSILKCRDGYDKWLFHTDKNINNDTYFCIGYIKDVQNIEMVLIVPNEDWICSLMMIGIVKKFRRNRSEGD